MASRGRSRARYDKHAGPAGVVPDELLEQLAAAGAPPDLLEVLANASELEEVLDGLIASGALPSPEEAFEAVLGGFTPLTDPDCDPLTAELTGYEFLATLRAAGAGTDLSAVLHSMIESAERVGGSEALAMTRVLGVTGPEAVRAAASAVATRLVAGGLPDAAWADAVGRPKAGACFGYSDLAGAQEVIALQFSYGRRQHAVSVLIDHQISGGVKDCYVAGRPRLLRRQYAEVAEMRGASLHDYSASEAVEILERALAARPCPVELDQIEDVGIHLDLLRSRVDLLRRPALPNRPARDAARRSVHRLKIGLRGAKPPIWRRIEVASDTSLEQLNDLIQAAFGWLGGHLWVFTTANDEFGPADAELGFRDAARPTIAMVVPRAGDRLRYIYDFGDDWQHNIVVEQVAAADATATYPRCLDGRRAAPPDDCGGIGAYEELLEALADPGNPDHAERTQWLGDRVPIEWNPASFDRAAIDSALLAVASDAGPGPVARPIG
jgi:hypothetical protein